MSNNPRDIFFDANPLVKSNKSGVGYFTERLVRALSTTFPSDVRMHGHYFNFGNKYNAQVLPAGENIDYTSSKLLPERAVNLLRRAGVNLPLSVFYRGPIDIAIFPNFVSMPANKRIFSVVFVHDLSFVDHPEYVSSRNGSFLRKAVPRSIKRADLVVTISEFTKARIHERYQTPLEKIYVMYIPPVKTVKSDETILKRHKLNKYLLFVGNLEPRKNIAGLLRGYANLPESIKKDIPLVLVGGKGWKDEEIMTLLDKLLVEGNNIIVTGYVSDEEKAALYSNATICIMPSNYEGFGMPILEAMQYSKPVICSDIDVFHEVAGNSARYFDKDNPQSLTDLLVELLSNQ